MKREEAINLLKKNINILKSIKNIDLYEDQYKKQQLIVKNEMMINYINENPDIDIQKLCNICNEMIIEINELTFKWLQPKNEINQMLLDLKCFCYNYDEKEKSLSKVFGADTRCYYNDVSNLAKELKEHKFKFNINSNDNITIDL